MVGAYAHCTFNLNPRPSSIDTPLHGFVPARHVDHTHPNAAISLAACAKGKELTKEIYGDEVIWTEWQRPGFDLGLILEKLCKDHPKAKGAIMGQHGLINWHEDDKKCYELTLELVGRAAEAIAKKDRGEKTFGGEKYKSPGEKERKALWLAILPWLRGKVSTQQRMIGTVQEDATILRFVNSKDAPRLAEMGTSCPDHFLRTKIKPLYVAWDPATGDVAKLRSLLENGLEAYRADYKKYYEKCKRKDSPAMRDPNPTVVLIPGLGMVAWGKSKSESRVTAEFYNCAVEVMRGAEALGGYINLPSNPADSTSVPYRGPQAWREPSNNDSSWENQDGTDPVIKANSIVEWTGGTWTTIWDPEENTLEAADILGEEFSPTYIQNIRTGFKYQWEGTQWIKAFEGEYKSGEWSFRTAEG